MINRNFLEKQDLKLPEISLCDVIAELLKPTTFISNYRFGKEKLRFKLTQRQVDILNSKIITPQYSCDHQIELGCCLSNSTSEQECGSFNLTITVNNYFLSLSSLKTTINITQYVKISPIEENTIAIESSTVDEDYKIYINLVRELTTDELVERFKSKRVMNPDYTKSLIVEKFNDTDSDIMTTTLCVSLLCPLGQIKMITPCRSIACNHLQCFDLKSFLQMYQKKMKWVCPVCHKYIFHNDLIIDGYFINVLTPNQIPSDINQIEIHKDGTWSIDTNHNNIETIEIISDNDDGNDNEECASSSMIQIKNEPIENDTVPVTLSNIKRTATNDGKFNNNSNLIFVDFFESLCKKRRQ